MSEDLKLKRYNRIKEQLSEMYQQTDDLVSRMATMAGVLHHKVKQYFWTGFFFLKGEDLILGPYQGPVIQMKIEKGIGVCQECIQQQKAIYVPDVTVHKSYIHCNNDTKSELVIPIFDKSNTLIGVFDINSRNINGFDETDINEIEEIVKKLFI